MWGNQGQGYTIDKKKSLAPFSFGGIKRRPGNMYVSVVHDHWGEMKRT